VAERRKATGYSTPGEKEKKEKKKGSIKGHMRPAKSSVI
jgi:hypothetical protein